MSVVGGWIGAKKECARMRSQQEPCVLERDEQVVTRQLVEPCNSQARSTVNARSGWSRNVPLSRRSASSTCENIFRSVLVPKRNERAEPIMFELADVRQRAKPAVATDRNFSLY